MSGVIKPMSDAKIPTALDLLLNQNSKFNHLELELEHLKKNIDTEFQEIKNNLIFKQTRLLEKTSNVTKQLQSAIALSGPTEFVLGYCTECQIYYTITTITCTTCSSFLDYKTISEQDIITLLNETTIQL